MVPLTGVLDIESLKEVSPFVYISVFVLVLFSALFSSAETAFSTSNPIRLRNFIDNGRKGAKKALYLTENFENTVTTILIGNNVVNIALTSIASTFFLKIITDQSLASVLNTLIITLIVLIFGEVIPKQAAKTNPEAFALRYSTFIYYIRYLFIFFVVIIKPFKKMFKFNKIEESNKITDEELETLIDDLEEQGVIDETVSDYIQNSLEITDKTVQDIMTPRVDIVVFDVEDSFDDLIQIVKETKFTRIPIFKDDKDNIIGKVHSRDIMLAYMNKKEGEEIKITDIMSEIKYVSETTKVNDLISLMKQSKQHICIVTGEFGGTEGLVTMEDAIEVVFGQIYDEYDNEQEVDEVVKVDENKYIVPAHYKLNELLDDLDLPEIESQYSSIAGFMNEKLAKIPEVGDEVEESFVIHQSGVNEDSIVVFIKFTVKEVDDRRLNSVIAEVYQKEIEELVE